MGCFIEAHSCIVQRRAGGERSKQEEKEVSSEMMRGWGREGREIEWDRGGEARPEGR